MSGGGGGGGGEITERDIRENERNIETDGQKHTDGQTGTES